MALYAAAGTENRLTDTAQNNDETNSENTNAENAVIKCKDGSQVTLCGSGTLVIEANGKNGIKSGAAITITAYSSRGDGFDSNGSLTISGGTVAVWTANTADNQPLDADGTITISGGTVLAAGGSSTLTADAQTGSISSGMGGFGGPGGQMPDGQFPGGSGQRPDDAESGQRPSMPSGGQPPAAPGSGS